MNPEIILWSIVSALSCFLFGFDTVVISRAERTVRNLWGLSPWIHGVSSIVPACLSGFIAAHAVGQGAVIWAFIDEIFPDRHRATTKAIGGGPDHGVSGLRQPVFAWRGIRFLLWHDGAGVALGGRDDPRNEGCAAGGACRATEIDAMPSKPAAPASPAAFYRVEPPREASLRCVRVRERKLGVPWHFHPEYQLTLLVSGSGQRVVGDSIAAVGAGDLTLLGPSLPHFWDVDLPNARRAGRRQRVDAIIVQFDQAAFGESFWMLPETARVAKLLRSARRGLVFSARARAVVEEAIVRLARLPALPRLLGLIEILDQLAADARAKPICSPAYAAPDDRGEQHRLAAVIRRIQEHVCEGLEPPHRSELAALAGMAERTLSRSFRGQMGRTLPQFANELRIGRARRMLMETSLAVTAVAQQCGFRNLSNFNTQFRRLEGQTPQAFRQACRHRLAVCTPSLAFVRPGVRMGSDQRRTPCHPTPSYPAASLRATTPRR